MRPCGDGIGHLFVVGPGGACQRDSNTYQGCQMSVKSIPLTGGESVYCINENQLKEAFRLAEEDPDASPRIQAAVEKLENEFSRNERAAVAFVVIDRLLKSATKPPA